MVRSVRRRLLIAVGASLGAPLIAAAQIGSKVWRIGFIQHARRFRYDDDFASGLRELGYDVGRDLVVEWRFSGGHIDRLPSLAADLIERKADVIICVGTAAVEATKRVSSTTPIVMALVGDPVASGFVTSLGRPGGNITGLSLATTDTSAKWLELANTVAPGPRIGVLADPNQQTARWHIKNIQSAAAELKVTTRVAYAPNAGDLEKAIASLAQERVTSFVILPGGVFESNATQIARTALKHHLASIAPTANYAEEGVLVSYGQNYREFIRRAAGYVDRILKGAKPGQLPVEQPIIFELVVNLATAKLLGLTLPQTVLARADRVIE